MSTHTPGPWVSIPSKSYDGQIFRNVFTESEKMRIAWCDGANNPTAKKNAQLMAAAPDLLQALIELMNAWDNCLAPNDGDYKTAVTRFEKGYKASSDAIKKATGEKA